MSRHCSSPLNKKCLWAALNRITTTLISSRYLVGLGLGARPLLSQSCSQQRQLTFYYEKCFDLGFIVGFRISRVDQNCLPPFMLCQMIKLRFFCCIFCLVERVTDYCHPLYKIWLKVDTLHNNLFASVQMWDSVERQVYLGPALKEVSFHFDSTKTVFGSQQWAQWIMRWEAPQI